MYAYAALNFGAISSRSSHCVSYSISRKLRSRRAFSSCELLRAVTVWGGVARDTFPGVEGPAGALALVGEVVEDELGGHVNTRVLLGEEWWTKSWYRVAEVCTVE